MTSSFIRRTLGLSLIAGAIMLTGATPPTCDSDNGGLTLPAGFCALVVADDLGLARHAVAAPNGDLYVAMQGGRGGKTAGGRRDAARR